MHDFIPRYVRGERDFVNADLRDTRVNGVQINGCDFRGANLRASAFLSSDIRGCDFSGAALDGTAARDGTTFATSKLLAIRWPNADIDEAYFVNCEISGFLNRGRLNRVQFDRCTVSDLSLYRSYVSGLRFANTTVREINVTECTRVDADLEPLLQEDALRGSRNVTVDWRTVARSILAPELPDFMWRTNMPDVVVTYLMEACRAATYRLTTLMRSTFISYGAPDSAFARRLRDELYRSGAETFFFELDAVPGERLHQMMRRVVNQYDRTILVCSRASLERPGVKNEIQEALSRESRDGSATYLIPVTLDSYVFEWSDPVGGVLRDRVIADFRGMESRPEHFGQMVARLLQVLKMQKAP